MTMWSFTPFKFLTRGYLIRHNISKPKVTALASDDLSKGYSGAEIIALCRDAALHAISEMDDGIIDRPQIRMKHLLLSLNNLKPRTTNEMLRFYESFRGRH